jgi:general secretion pathway protein G
MQNSKQSSDGFRHCVVSVCEGYTFVEVLIVTVILVILASAVLPLAEVTTQRHQEAELRRSLREIRTAIDGYKDAVDQGLIASAEVELESEGYPPNLEILVGGVRRSGDDSEQVLRFLRRIPVDPMTGARDWGLRAYEDPPGTRSWSGRSVFDVYTKSRGVGLDGSEYRDW